MSTSFRESTQAVGRASGASYGLRAACGAAALCLCAGLSPQVEAQTTVIDVGAEWAFFRGTEAPPADWNTVEFDDSGWEFGPSGFGYGDGDDNTTLDDMQNGYLTVFIRKRFEVASLDDAAALQISIQYDDGFVAYINGVEAARSASMGARGGPAAFNTAATTEHEVNATAELYPVHAEAMATLVAGENVIAISGHNVNLPSSDCSLIPTLRSFAAADLCPISASCRIRTAGGVRVSWVNPVRPPPFTRVEIYRDGRFLAEVSTPTSTTYNDETVGPGEHLYEVVAYVRDQPCTGDGVPSCTIVVESQEPLFRRGDSDDNATVNLTDAVFTLLWLFQQGTAPACLDAADTDDNGATNLTDGVFLLQHLFQQGPPPPPPGITSCGADGTPEDTLAECAYRSACA